MLQADADAGQEQAVTAASAEAVQDRFEQRDVTCAQFN
jgi:hypothetical protein